MKWPPELNVKDSKAVPSALGTNGHILVQQERSTANGSCHKCGSMDHWARECPQGQGGGGRAGRGNGPAGRGRGGHGGRGNRDAGRSNERGSSNTNSNTSPSNGHPTPALEPWRTVSPYTSYGVVLAAVTSDPKLLRHASIEQQSNPSTVFAALDTCSLPRVEQMWLDKCDPMHERLRQMCRYFEADG